MISVNLQGVTQSFTILKKLMDMGGDGKKALILVDEAQALPDVTLEALRLMTNLETKKDAGSLARRIFGKRKKLRIKRAEMDLICFCEFIKFASSGNEVMSVVDPGLSDLYARCM